MNLKAGSIAVLILVSSVSSLGMSKREQKVISEETLSDLNKRVEELEKDNKDLGRAKNQFKVALTNALDSKSELTDRDRKLQASISCLVAQARKVGLSDKESVQVLGLVRDSVITNDEQMFKYLKFNNSLSGKLLVSDNPNAGDCEN